MDKNKKLLWQIPFLTLLVIGTILIIRQQQSMPYQKDAGQIFGTLYHVTYQSDQNLKTEIEEELKKVDAAFSMFNPQSTVSQLNRDERPAQVRNTMGSLLTMTGLPPR